VSRIGSWLILSFRLHRWEVLASAAGVAILSAAMLWFTWQLRALAAAEPRCLDPMTFVAACEQSSQAFYELSNKAEWLSYLAWLAPFSMGLLLGVPLVAREVEHRTAGVAWTLSRSRTWWLVRRASFLILVLVVLLLVVAAMGEVLTAAEMPTRHLDRDFAWYGRRGALIVVRGVASLGIGVLIGAWLGRVMPALLVGIAATVLIFSGISFGMDRWIEGEAIVAAPADDTVGARSLGQRVELPSGQLVDYGELARRGVTVQVIDEENRLFADPEDLGHPERMIGLDRTLLVPGRLYPTIVLREAGAVGGAAVLLALAATFVVGRRRPG
jgi:hypothetical protein